MYHVTEGMEYNESSARDHEIAILDQPIDVNTRSISITLENALTYTVTLTDEFIDLLRTKHGIETMPTRRNVRDFLTNELKKKGIM